jgi:hypothetical protein
MPVEANSPPLILLVEAPGAAPGSKSFIIDSVYHHSQPKANTCIILVFKLKSKLVFKGFTNGHALH